MNPEILLLVSKSEEELDQLLIEVKSYPITDQFVVIEYVIDNLDCNIPKIKKFLQNLPVSQCQKNWQERHRMETEKYKLDMIKLSREIKIDGILRDEIYDSNLWKIRWRNYYKN